MNKQEAINTAIGNYLSYLLYGDREYLNTAEHWLYYAERVSSSNIRFSLR